MSMADRIRKLAHLPSQVVAERLGVTVRFVCRARWTDANREYVREQSKKYRPKQAMEHVKAWRAHRPKNVIADRWRKSNPERFDELQRRYRESPKGMETARRRARRRLAREAAAGRAGIPGGRWQPEHDRLLMARIKGGATYAEIARELGVARGAVCGRVSRLEGRS